MESETGLGYELGGVPLILRKTEGRRRTERDGGPPALPFPSYELRTSGSLLLLTAHCLLAGPTERLDHYAPLQQLTKACSNGSSDTD